MATMNSVIEHVDRVKPNVYLEDDKYEWMSRLDGMIAREVLHTELPAYDLPADADRPLLVEHPYDDLYSLYVMAMIDFYNHEYDHYNNAVLVFTERLDQYKAWALRTGHTCTAKNFRNIMG